MSDEAKWYVVHTYSGYENKVASNLETTVANHQLQDLIHEIRVPTEKVLEVGSNGKTKEVERKIFPGYVIVKMIMTDEAWYVIKNVRGVTGFVGSGTKPTPLTEEEKAEQAQLRAEYIKEYRATLRGILENTVIQRPDGTKEKLKKRSDKE